MPLSHTGCLEGIHTRTKPTRYTTRHGSTKTLEKSLEGNRFNGCSIKGESER